MWNFNKWHRTKERAEREKSCLTFLIPLHDTKNISLFPTINMTLTPGVLRPLRCIWSHLAKPLGVSPEHLYLLFQSVLLISSTRSIYFCGWGLCRTLATPRYGLIFTHVVLVRPSWGVSRWRGTNITARGQGFAGGWQFLAPPMGRLNQVIDWPCRFHERICYLMDDWVLYPPFQLVQLLTQLLCTPVKCSLRPERGWFRCNSISMAA